MISSAVVLPNFCAIRVSNGAMCSYASIGVSAWSPASDSNGWRVSASGASCTGGTAGGDGWEWVGAAGGIGGTPATPSGAAEVRRGGGVIEGVADCVVWVLVLVLVSVPGIIVADPSVSTISNRSSG